MKLGIACLLVSPMLVAQSPVAPTNCLESVRDQTTGDCVELDSIPQLGRIYPLGRELNIDPDGRVLLGRTTASSDAQLEVFPRAGGSGIAVLGAAGILDGHPGGRILGGAGSSNGGFGATGLFLEGGFGEYGGNGLEVRGGISNVGGHAVVATASGGEEGGTGVIALGGDGVFPGPGIDSTGGTGLGLPGSEGVIARGGLSQGSQGGDGLVAIAGYGIGGEGLGIMCWGDLAASGTKSFVQHHPTDPSLEIHFVCLEGNESGTYFRGTTQTQGGSALIEVPEEFACVTEAAGLTVQLTPVGAPARLWIESESLDRIVVRTDIDVRFHYLVNGIRRGYEDFQCIRTRREPPQARPGGR